MAENSEPTAEGQAEGSQTQSQSTSEQVNNQTAGDQEKTSKGVPVENIVLFILMLAAGAIGVLYVNRKMARDANIAAWQAEEEYHQKRLFGDAWRDIN